MTVYNNKSFSPYYDTFWGRQLAPPEAMPLDIAYLVADYSHIEDLVALSIVSKPLRQLLSDPGVWKTFYSRPSLLLPPGPYDWQSASYLINALLRAEKVYSVWPSSSSCPEILHSRSLSFGQEATFSVLLGRWLLVAEGSTLVCYDSQCGNISESAKTLFDEGAGRRILRVCSTGSVREDGTLAFAVLFYEDSFTIAKILTDQGRPSEIQTVLTVTPTVFEGWIDMADVQLYHRLLVVSIGNCSSHLGTSGCLVLMDIITLRQYRIAASTDDAGFSSMRTITFFFATQTHLVKVIEYSQRYKVRFKLECFPLPVASQDETSESNMLYPSHQSRILFGPKLRQCSVIHESPIDGGTGRVSFTICGMNVFLDGSRLEIMEVSLEPDGSITFTGFQVTKCLVTSFCMGLSRQHGCGVALRTNKQPLAFALDYRGPGSFSLAYSKIHREFPGCEIVASDTFAGTAFFFRRSAEDTAVEVVDFARDAGKAKGRLPERVVDGESKMECNCGECWMSGG